MSELNKEAYIKLIDEDLKWLHEQPLSIERDHIEIVLRTSILLNYPDVNMITDRNKAHNAIYGYMDYIMGHPEGEEELSLVYKRCQLILDKLGYKK